MFTVRHAHLQVARIVLALAIVAGTSSAVQAATASWDPNGEPNLAGYKLSYGTQPGVHTITIDVGNVTTYELNPAPGLYYVVVQAYTTSGELSDKSAEVMFMVPVPNRAPALVQPANQSSTLYDRIALAVSASDPDGTAVSFTATGLPPGLSLDRASGIIGGIALAKGSYLVTVTVSDGALWVSRTFTWTVKTSVDAPIIVDLWPVDTTLSVNNANTSADEYLLAHTWPANQVAAAILMKFDLSPIPPGATIQSAILNMSLVGEDGDVADPTYRVSLHQIINRNPDIDRATSTTADGVTAWTANQCCFGGLPMAQADLSPARAVTMVNRTLGLKVWNVISVARAWLAAPGSNYGILLNGDNTKGADRYRVFASMQDPIAARRPFMRITYTLPIGADPAAVLAMSAAGTVSGAVTTAAPSTELMVANGANQLSLGDSYVGVSGDFDGDGRADVATYRLPAGEWRMWTSGLNFATPMLTVWGTAGDIPMPADYDGDRVTDLAIYRPSTGTWHMWLSRSQTSLSVRWGTPEDRPVSTDHDGDGKADLALIRNGGYEILLSSTNYSTSVTVR